MPYASPGAPSFARGYGGPPPMAGYGGDMMYSTAGSITPCPNPCCARAFLLKQTFFTVFVSRSVPRLACALWALVCTRVVYVERGCGRPPHLLASSPLFVRMVCQLTLAMPARAMAARLLWRVLLLAMRLVCKAPATRCPGEPGAANLYSVLMCSSFAEERKPGCWGNSRRLSMQEACAE